MALVLVANLLSRVEPVWLQGMNDVLKTEKGQNILQVTASLKHFETV